MLLLKSQYYIFNSIFELDINFLNYLREFLRLTRIECMAIGGIGAYILYYKKPIIKKLIFTKLVSIYFLCNHNF